MPGLNSPYSKDIVGAACGFGDFLGGAGSNRCFYYAVSIGWADSEADAVTGRPPLGMNAGAMLNVTYCDPDGSCPPYSRASAVALRLSEINFGAYPGLDACVAFHYFGKPALPSSAAGN
ncbi:hypothetical protein SAMN02800694_1197 [Luteibacter sp. UNCMF331Sha3.1]|uniref:hypothetical protein n=1 Tax=Luteibacter sp. UNCMF331Sha3.1 TaxID=1502760 RepID=UPI0008B97E52|nr:hypothetical protein [Luteibacter sp. UNCMF331Sha3.1]SEM47164.1 hypothetical protein SAMN02800694_1197 [Luteibacter sp. UNCMF331Sha3.1]